MKFIETKMRELETYCPSLTKQDDFDEFWDSTCAISAQEPLNPKAERIDYPATHVAVYSIQYSGFDGTPIHGWYLHPLFCNAKKFPCIINFHGFGDSKGFPSEFMHWIVGGYAVLTVDCRDQGGTTGNCACHSNGMVGNVITRGLLNEQEFYYRAVYMDSVRAIDFAQTRAEVDPEKIIVRGASQGGALTMAVCALDKRPVLAFADCPSNSDLESRVAGFHGAYAMVSKYLQLYPDHLNRVMKTLSYFDTMNLADRIHCRVVASVGLCDEICPAKCYFATYNRIQSPKEIKVYPFNGHECGRGWQIEHQLYCLTKYL